MAVRQIQSTFSLGELDKKLYAKTDFSGYFKGARKLRNVMVIPQGGIIRRFGLNYGVTIVDTGDANDPITDINETNGITFDFSKTKRFDIIARPNDRTGTPGVAFDIYLDLALQSTEITTDYDIDMISDLTFLRAQGRVIILHEEVQPKQLVRGVNDTTWTLTDITFANVPGFDFSIIDGTSYRGGSDIFTPSATTGVGITLTGSSAFFTAGHVGGLFIGGGGLLRITAVNAGGTVATGDTFQDFDSTAAIKGVNALLNEAAWGDYSGGTPAGSDRGWPSKGAFFQTRMILGNSLTLPALLWGSAASDFYNFDDSESSDLDAFGIGVGSDGNEEIQDIIGTKALVALGFNGVYSTSLFIDQPLTASNVFMNEQDRAGSANLEAQVLDGQIFFADENNQQINSALYDIGSSSFDVLDTSLLSPQLIDTPTSTASFRPSTNAGSFYMATNNDGTLAMFQSLKRQDIAAWTLATTRGSFGRVFASRDACSMIVRRAISTGATTTGLIDNVYTANSDFEGFSDITTESESATTDVEVFSKDGDYLLIGHESPFYRIEVTLDTVANSTITPTFEYLDKLGDWNAFTPTDGSTGFTGNGTILWVLDTDTPDWFPVDLEDKKIPKPKRVAFPENTVNGVKEKFWIRIKRNIPGEIDVGFIVDPLFTLFTNVTQSLNNATADVTLFAQDNDYLVIGHSSSFSEVNVALNTAASATIIPTFEYLDSADTWVTFVPTADGTTGFTVNGAITWTAASLTGWSLGSVNGTVNKFWIRIRRTEGLPITAPIEDTIYLNISTQPIEESLLINVANRLHLESVSFNSRMDSVESTTSDSVGLVTGLDHLLGQQVYAVVNSVPRGPFFVDSSGEINVGIESSSDVVVGINFIPTVIPMPIVAEFAFAQSVYHPKHITTIYIDYFESLGITVNGYEIPSLQLGNFQLDQIPKPVTDFYEMTPMRGWDPRVENIISQELPLPMTIIGIGYKLEVS